MIIQTYLTRANPSVDKRHGVEKRLLAHKHGERAESASRFFFLFFFSRYSRRRRHVLFRNTFAAINVIGYPTHIGFHTGIIGYLVHSSILQTRRLRWATFETLKLCFSQHSHLKRGDESPPAARYRREKKQILFLLLLNRIRLYLIV